MLPLALKNNGLRNRRFLVSRQVSVWYKKFIAVYDSFDRENSNTSMGTSDTGQTYSAVNQTGSTVPWGISSNQAYAVDSHFQNICFTNSGLWDCTLEVTIATVGNQPGVCFRVVDFNNYFVSNQSNLFVRVAGTFTNIGTWTYAVGDTLKVEMYGSSIKCYTNNVLQLSVTNTNHPNATSHGMRVQTDTTSRFDNLKITL